jgi:predicted phosphodiesterase
MIIAILSDIHANYEALDTILRYLHTIDVRDIVCCGDIVGYGPSPVECISTLQKYSFRSVYGNHDQAFLTDSMDIYFNEDAVVALNIQKNLVHKEEISFIQSLPAVIQDKKFTITHSYLDPQHPYRYVLDENTAYRNATLNKKNSILFIGHSHNPSIFEIHSNNSIDVYKAKNGLDWTLQPDCKYVINVGSVGQSRDGNSDCSFGLFDTDAMQIKIFRFPYPIYKTQEKMAEKGFPEFLIKRLAKGF